MFPPFLLIPVTRASIPRCSTRSPVIPLPEQRCVPPSAASARQSPSQVVLRGWPFLKLRRHTVFGLLGLKQSSETTVTRVAYVAYVYCRQLTHCGCSTRTKPTRQAFPDREAHKREKTVYSTQSERQSRSTTGTTYLGFIPYNINVQLL